MTPIKRNLYLYAYNKLNDVYTIRGVDTDGTVFESRVIEHIPSDLICQIRDEYARISGFKVESVEPTASFSSRGSNAVIDFHGRKYTPAQVEEIMNSLFVDLPHVNELKKGTGFVKRLRNIISNKDDNK